jgi:lactoylglutathione lyase
MSLVWSHIGLCVSDLDRSVRFYCEGLGAAAADRYDLDDTAMPGLAEALEVDSPVSLVSQIIDIGHLRIELLAYRTPEAQGRPSEHRNQLGLTHLAFMVDDPDATAARLVELGGTLLPDTRQSVGIEVAFVADPDGTRVELLGRPAPTA